ncbi:MAG TPA: chloride channel protein [Bryobacterales bacterium]|jgi:CIC family chloride channel protein|nr:chloride channel protein [Bryobacterales bacterium]
MAPQIIEQSWQMRLRSWADVQRVRQHENKLLLILTLVIGAVVGLVVVAFIWLTENLGARMYPAGGAAWRRVFVPTAGSLIAGFLLDRYFPNARGSGIPQTKAALFLRDGYIRFRTVLGKFACSSLSLASGIALGREGPSVQVGAGIASVLGRRLGLSSDKIRSLVPVGTSAALAAAFNTPISAVLFTLEEILGDLHAPLLGSVVLSSATAWIVLRLVLGDEPLFHVPAYQLVHPLEFGIYAALGVAGGFVSVGFVKLLLFLRKRFLAMPRRTSPFQPAAGGVLAGLLGWFAPEVLGVGYGHVSSALNGQMSLGLMALLAPLKVLATAACYASGNAGGIFGPSLFIGAMTGGAVGTAAHYFLPDYTGSVGAYALVGMGTAFAGIIRAPLTSVIMIFEITRDYSIIVPVMLSNLISFFISHRLQEEPIYEALQHQDGIHLPAGGGRHEGILLVRDAVRQPVKALSAEDRLSDRIEIIESREADAWPVVNERGLMGMVTAAQVRQAIEQGNGARTFGDLVPDPEAMRPLRAENFPHLHADQSLDLALRRMAESGLTVLPVVSRTNLRELQGTVSLNDALTAYGLGKDRKPPAQPAVKSPEPSVPLASFLAVLVGILVLASFFTYLYRAQRRERAAREFQQGTELARQGRDQEAIENYRHALSVSHSREHRLALALELVKVGRWNEARSYLQELLREDPASGVVHLAMARIEAGEGRTQEAVTEYNRAIYGSWAAAVEGPVQARFELADLLARTGAKQQAAAELIKLLGETPESDFAARKKIARLLLDYGSARQSAAILREVLSRDSQDPEAYAELGAAEFALEDYAAAKSAYGHAARLNPSDAAAQARLGLCNEILALNPRARSLRAAERYARSKNLVQRVLQAAGPCIASRGNVPLPDDIRRLSQKARQLLASRSGPRSYRDAADDNIALAGQLWEARNRFCASPPPDEALSRVLALLAH